MYANKTINLVNIYFFLAQCMQVRPIYCSKSFNVGAKNVIGQVKYQTGKVLNSQKSYYVPMQEVSEDNTLAMRWRNRVYDPENLLLLTTTLCSINLLEANKDMPTHSLFHYLYCRLLQTYSRIMVRLHLKNRFHIYKDKRGDNTMLWTSTECIELV